MKKYSNDIGKVTEILANNKNVTVYTSSMYIYEFYSNINLNTNKVYYFDLNSVLETSQDNINLINEYIYDKKGNNTEKVIKSKGTNQNSYIKELEGYVKMYQNRKSIKVANKLGSILKWLKFK
ncbi:MAG: hypothetical protein ACK5HR_03945 [Mycoplasmatales bacterium]